MLASCSSIPNSVKPTQFDPFAVVEGEPNDTVARLTRAPDWKIACGF